MKERLTVLRGGAKRDKLEQEINQSEREARTVLPGIQALFGFQLIAAFSTTFKSGLAGDLQRVHWLALISIALSVMFFLTPSAYHRQIEGGRITQALARVASLFLTIGMIPMMLGIVLDVYVISVLVTSSRPQAGWISALLLAGFILLWFVFPRVAQRRLQRGAHAA